ncbi:MAG: nitroreductase family protein [Chloroflexota bacterium]
MSLLNLTPDQLLSTTRSVRKRLDLTRPVEREVLEECLALAQQAPTGSNRQDWQFVVVTDARKRSQLADIYRRGADVLRNDPNSPRNRPYDDPELRASYEKVVTSSDYLYDHMHAVPVLLIPCVSGRVDKLPPARQAGKWGSILPGTWSFMLAARSRGLGTCLTTVHLQYERDAASVLGIPYEDFTQAGLIPVAYTIGTDFKPGPRAPLSTMVRWDSW